MGPVVEGRSLILGLTLISFLTLGLFTSQADGQALDYNVGVGISDVTGPVAEVGMMGYASATQVAHGIHTRLFARAFAFQDLQTNDIAVYVSIDCAMVGSAIKLEVVRELAAIFGPTKYTAKNVLLSATHTHSGPGGYMQYALYGISSYGFLMSNFRAVVDGIVEAIVQADKVQKGKVYIAEGDLEDSNINRSPSSYLANPPEERALYNGDTDKKMVLLRIEGENGEKLGLINWFAVHPTSMQNTNKQVSGDNKGYASMYVEYKINTGKRPGQGDFVAAFGSSNLGDVSPNTDGAKCQAGNFIGQDCHFDYSTCGNYTQNCWALGPGGLDMVESTRKIGENQALKAIELFDEAENHARPVSGSVQYSHQYINMSEYKVTLKKDDGTTEEVFTCPGAMGYSFAAGTTDGPGAFNFFQGDDTGNPFWDLIRDVLHAPTKAQIDCHAPKPILLDVGETHFPYDWVASIVETQMLKIGNFYIVGMPGELTTMAGRRVRKAIAETIGGTDATVVIAGLSNVYTHYVTTYEEYQKQRYEAASTLYGPHTLSAYIQQFSLLTKSMLEGTIVDAGPTPPLLIKGQISLNPPIILDAPPLGKKIGDCSNEPPFMSLLGDKIKVTFVAGHLRNNPMRGGTFLLVEKAPANVGERWTIVATDADWSTNLTWSRPFPLSPWSEVDITWNTNTKDSLVPIEEGFYRIRHFGYYKPALKSPVPYSGITQTFKMCSHPATPFCTSKEAFPGESRKPRKLNTVEKLWSYFVGKK